MTIKDFIRNNPNSLVALAYNFAFNAHLGQKRKSGEPYFNHCVAVADILLSWNMDDETLAAGLLHDVLEDTKTTQEQIKKNFGEQILFLVDGVSKLGKIKYRGIKQKAENMRKFIFALSTDLRVIFIKLADRLHNMRTLNFLSKDKQKRIALETDEIYAPIAYRLGMQSLSGELQDLAFPYIYPDEYKWLIKNVKEKYETRTSYLKKIVPILKEALIKNNIKVLNLDFRAKRWSSLYKKLLLYDMDIEKIYDLVALRIIVPEIPDCYAALGIVHELWPPLPGRIKDYIAMPKPNGYKSLHTTVIGPNDKKIEIQIRTKEMHEENEFGIAAHWIYKYKKYAKNLGGVKLEKELDWIKQLNEWQNKKQNDDSSFDFLKYLKIDFFKDRIFVLTPKGDVLDLPNGSTPVDFAYHIHSEVGNSCVGAKVNDKIVPLNYKLKSGDIVEILTQKNKKPSEDWLSFVCTSIAKDHIKSALKQKNNFKNLPSKTEIRIVALSNKELIKNISSIILRSHFNILSFKTEDVYSKSYQINRIEIDSTNKEKIEKLILKLKDNLKDIKEISYKII
ncbi:MAG: RelA/SpoT family protein [Patescibacteria group bacterium]|nr:RelA/SpoT family protein [Patescibacteria group bacterium]MDW8279729.1 RelA/SpoT family protein [bacterium]